MRKEEELHLQLITPPSSYIKRFGSPSYKYYDTPDGHDLIPKLIYTTKWGAYFGGVFGSYMAIIRFPPPKQRMWLLFESVRRAIPFVLYPVVYTVSTYTVTNFRGKDDVLNANIGGAFAGFVFGTWYRNGWMALFATIASSYFCGLKKESVQMGYKFPAPPEPREYESSWVLRNMDFTLTKDIPGNWTSVPRPVQPPPPPPPPPAPKGICAGY